MARPPSYQEISRLSEDEAREMIEALRWPDGAICPHCGADRPYSLKPRPTSKRPGRKGLYKCRKCRKQFTVTVGTIFEDSHISLRTWLQAIHLLCASKKGMSAHQLHRMLDVSYKSAWFMAHRIRYAMTQPPLVGKLRGVVEADETYVGGKASARHGGRSTVKKTPVLTLIERDGRARSTPMKRVTSKNLTKAFWENVEPGTAIMTDDFGAYYGLPYEFSNRQIVKHGDGEYVRGEAHVNTAESFFSLLKRGIIGVYHHVGEGHLHRYAHEFDFRWNGRKVPDGVRAALAVKGAEGKRLMYRDPQGSRGLIEPL
jgi:transposase-like protein